MRHLRVELEEQFSIDNIYEVENLIESNKENQSENKVPGQEASQANNNVENSNFQNVFRQYVLQFTDLLKERRALKLRSRSKSFDSNFPKTTENSVARKKRKLSCQVDYVATEYNEEYDLSLGLSRSEERVLERIYSDYLNLLKWTGTAVDKLHEVASCMDNIVPDL